jgi:hypothetical protein
MIVRIGAEELSVDIGVDASLVGPRLPEFVVQGVRDEVIFLPLQNLIHAGCRRLGVWMLGGIVILRWEKAEMLPP